MAHNRTPLCHELRIGTGLAGLAGAAALRSAVFRGHKGGDDTDSHDAQSQHIRVTDAHDGQVVAYARIRTFANGAAAPVGYTGQYYDLSHLNGFRAPVAELGRLCVAKGYEDPDILRLLWAGVAHIVGENGITLVFGCSSFRGTDPMVHAATFDKMTKGHLLPDQLSPRVLAPHSFDMAKVAGATVQGAKSSPMSPPISPPVPPLLRSYLALGGQVSATGVIDLDLNTVHLFTALDVGHVPPARQTAFRQLARHAISQGILVD